jgi:hypothetical protein
MQQAHTHTPPSLSLPPSPTLPVCVCVFASRAASLPGVSSSQALPLLLLRCACLCGCPRASCWLPSCPRSRAGGHQRPPPSLCPPGRVLQKATSGCCLLWQGRRHQAVAVGGAQATSMWPLHERVGSHCRATPVWPAALQSPAPCVRPAASLHPAPAAGAPTARRDRCVMLEATRDSTRRGMRAIGHRRPTVVTQTLGEGEGAGRVWEVSPCLRGGCARTRGGAPGEASSTGTRSRPAVALGPGSLGEATRCVHHGEGACPGPGDRCQ